MRSCNDKVAWLVKIIADWLLIPLVLLALYELFFKVESKRRYEIYSRVLMAGLTSYVAAKILGQIYQPEQLRPFELLGVNPGAAYLNNPGFPSDHALFAMFLVLAVWYALRRRSITIIMLTMALLVGVGRILALVHTPLDVVGGMAVACLGALWYVDWPNAKLASSKKRKNVVK